MTRIEKDRAALLRREGILAKLVLASTGVLNPATLSKSYARPVDRVVAIITRNGGSIG